MKEAGYCFDISNKGCVAEWFSFCQEGTSEARSPDQPHFPAVVHVVEWCHSMGTGFLWAEAELKGVFQQHT